MRRGCQRPKLSVSELLEKDMRDEALCWDLKSGPDQGDRRTHGPPCNGDHDYNQHNCRIRNQHALVLKCWKCQLRLMYVPVRGSSGDTRKPSPLGMQKDSDMLEQIVGKIKNQARGQASAQPKAKATSSSSRMGGTPEDPPEVFLDPENAQAPQWDGDPETWTEYQAEVEAYLEHMKAARDRPEPPQWDGDPEHWEDYQAEAYAWMEADREKRARSHASSAMASGSSTPAPVRQRKAE